MNKPTFDIPILPEYAQVWDEQDNKMVVAYRTDYRRQKTVEFVKGKLFNSSDQKYTSKPYECAGYTEFLLLVNLEVTSTPTDIYVQVQFSDDSIHWYKYNQGLFCDLRWEDSAGDKKECFTGKVLTKWFRIYVVSSGCESTKTFKLNVKAVFN